MKKLVLSAAILLGGLSANASIVSAENVKIETSMETVYTLIDSTTLPEAVVLTLEDTYPGYVIDAAYINEDGQYKITLRIEESVGTFYIDAEGNWLKI